MRRAIVIGAVAVGCAAPTGAPAHHEMPPAFPPPRPPGDAMLRINLEKLCHAERESGAVSIHPLTARRAHIDAYLDRWRIVATRKLVVLERPGDVPVRIRATGNVYWKDLETGEDRRAAELSFAGEPPR